MPVRIAEGIPKIELLTLSRGVIYHVWRSASLKVENGLISGLANAPDPKKPL